MNKEPILILADILQTCMGLPDGRVFIYNQDYKIPKDSGLFIVIDSNGSEVYSNNNVTTPTIEGMQEENTIFTKEEYMVNILSKNSEARMRKEEIVMALNSIYSRQQQDLYQFKIAQRPSGFANLSELEGAGMLNRFAIIVPMLCWHSKINTIEYYNQFNNQQLKN